MSTDALDQALDDIVETLPKKKFSGKKLIILVAAVLLLLGIGGAAAYFFLFSGGEEVEEEMMEEGMMSEDEAVVPEADFSTPGVFMSIPDILVNLNTGDRRQRFLQMTVSLELATPEDQIEVERVLPRLLDAFQVYLRELREEDLEGSAGLYRVKEELLRRVNQSVAPIVVRDVLLEEMIIQ